MGDGNNRRLLLIGAAFLVGLLIGWWLLGWVLFPVTWTNAYLQDLRPEQQQMVLTAAAEAFELTGNAVEAQQRVRALGGPQEVADLAATAIARAEAGGDIISANRVRNLARVLGVDLSGATPAQTGAAEPAAGPEAGGTSFVAICGGLLAVLLVLAGGVLLYRLFFSQRSEEEYASQPVPFPAMDAPELSVAEDREEMLQPAAAAPVVYTGAPSLQEYTATFNLGEPMYDESFDIEVPGDGGYLGECGMTHSEFVGGDPNRVTALEVWLFDKSDIRTVTKVIMSDYAYGNQTLRDKLSSRGDAMLASPGQGFVLDAQTLRLEGEIVAVEYAEGEAPPRSTFRQVTVKMRVLRQSQ